VVTFQLAARLVPAVGLEVAFGVLRPRLAGDVRRPEKKYA
jgi:hypothetical protein